MKTILAILFLTLTAHAQKGKWPPASTWYSVWHPTWPYAWYAQEEPDQSVLLPYPISRVTTEGAKDNWCNQILTRQVQGDIRGKTVSVTFTVTVPEGGTWPYRGYWMPETYGSAPCRVKLFLIGYDSIYANVYRFTANLPDLTQWSVTGLVLPTQAGSYTTTLSAVVQDDQWTNVNGQRTGATICGSDVKQIGLSLSGGKWYSVGIGSPQPAESTITINSFSVQ